MPALSRSLSCLTPALLFILLVVEPAWAIRFGALGNSPVDAQQGWPDGSAAVFNARQRIAYWEHNGKWTSDCRGDAEAFNRVLADFALIEADTKQLVVHDGVGSSYWVGAVAPDMDAQVDWMFIVWQPDIWEQWQGALRGGRAKGAAPPAPRIDAYAGGNIRWEDVVIPEGIEVIDQRLEAHGFDVADGNVIEGTVHDIDTGDPLVATARLVLLERSDEGGYTYASVDTVDADDEGHWAFTSVAPGMYQITLSADGCASRMAGYAELKGDVSWTERDSGLATAVTLSGKVTDDGGEPLEDVEVQLRDTIATDGGYYTLLSTSTVTDRDGRFQFDQVPAGSASLRARKEGYVHAGLGETVETPADDVEFTISRSARVEIVVDFGGSAKPESYLVSIEPEDGLEVGSWGGSGEVDASGFRTFENVPPGTYVLWGRPNPGSDNEQTEKVTVKLKPGETTEVQLEAR